MDLAGVMGGTWAVRFRELEHFVRGGLNTSRNDPGDELPDAELCDREQRAALEREAARRVVTERS